MSDLIELDRRGRVGVVTLNRPDAMNAVNTALASAIGEALTEVEEDDGLAVAVITGRGNAFSAGADLKALASGERLVVPEHPEWGFAGLTERHLVKPIIAAVNGYALGGGFEIVLACDLAVMSADAFLGLPEVRWSLFAAAGGAIRLPRQLPLKAAMRYLLTGDKIPAADALRLDLVNSVVPHGEVLDAAMTLANKVAAGGPLGVRATKRLAQAALGANAEWDADVWRLNQESISVVFGSQDAAEGMAAFAEKRPAVWQGR
jgi:crotonobetainyl-CoA hydratase